MYVFFCNATANSLHGIFRIKVFICNRYFSSVLRNIFTFLELCPFLGIYEPVCLPRFLVSHQYLLRVLILSKNPPPVGVRSYTVRNENWKGSLCIQREFLMISMHLFRTSPLYYYVAIFLWISFMEHSYFYWTHCIAQRSSYLSIFTWHGTVINIKHYIRV